MKDDLDILKKLESLKRPNLYKVPDNYFETLVPNLQDRINLNEVKKRSFFAIFKQKPVLAYSTLVASVVFIVFVGFKTILPAINNHSDKAMKTDDIALFLDNQAFSIDDETFANSIETDKSVIKHHVEQNDTIKYLLDNNIDPNEILNEL